ncbi:helix-turn-helix transcriptional regulator [Salinispora arenicola]|uniref:helix-turn-helix transcriptional regulator n=1 Tax=Salinispora arenicola TaxID=168697 RepID=UPI000374EABD|nr:hypothetical protein [Salinispora arenicola]
MQTRVIHGRPATDRPGIAERHQRAEHTIDRLAAQRETTGFPQPIDVETTGRGVRARGGHSEPQGREWYALDDLDTFFATYDVKAAGHSRVHDTKLHGDPNELLTARQAATELKVSLETFRSWVRDSTPAWNAGQPGYLPRPDAPGGNGIAHKWKRATLQTFVNERAGKASAAAHAHPPRATPADLQAILQTADGALTTAQLMTAMANRLGRPVSRQTITRLRRRLRENQAQHQANPH